MRNLISREWRKNTTSTVQSQNLAVSYFAQKTSSRRKRTSRFNGSMIISKTSGKKVKRRRKTRGKIKRQRKRVNQSKPRNHNVYNRAHLINVNCL